MSAYATESHAADDRTHDDSLRLTPLTRTIVWLLVFASLAFLALPTS